MKLQRPGKPPCDKTAHSFAVTRRQPPARALGMIAALGIWASATLRAALVVVPADINWSALTGGSGPGGLPGATDTVMVISNATLTVDLTNAVCANLQLGGTNTGSGNGALVFQADSRLTCATNLTVGNATGTGSLDFSSGGRLQIAGAVVVNALGSFNAGTGIIEYNGAGAQTIVSTLGAYNHLQVGGGGTKTLGGNITVNGNLIIGAGATLSVGASNYNITLAGNWINDGGVFNAGTGTVRLIGSEDQSIGGIAPTSFSRLVIDKTGGMALAEADFTVTGVFTNLAGVFNADNRMITFSGSGTPLVISGGTFDPATSSIAYTSTSGATIAGGLTYHNLSVVGNSGGDTFTLGGPVTVANTLSIGLGTLNASSQTLTLLGTGAPLQLNDGTFSPGTSTVTYSNAIGATIPAVTFNHLTLAGGGNFELSGPTTIGGTLTLAGGNLAIGSNVLTLNGAISLAGGTLAGGTNSDLVIGGTSANTTLPGVTLRNLTINRANGVTLGGPVLVGNTLTLTAGTLSGASNLTLGDGATISRQTGSLSGTPTFGSTVNLVYTGSTSVVTGPEVPANPTVLNRFTVNNTATVTLGSPLYVNGHLVLATSANLDVSTSNHPIFISGNWTNTGTGTFTARGGTVTFNGTGDQFICGTASTLFNNLTINKGAGTVNLAANTTVNGLLTLTAGTLTLKGFTLALNGPPIAGDPNGLVASAASKLSFGGSASGVSLPAAVTTLNGLTINNANGVVMSGDLTVNGTLTLTSGTLGIGTNTLTLNGAVSRTSGNLGGGPAANLVFSGSGSATTLPPVTLNNLMVNRASGITLGGAVTINGTLTLALGALSIGANTLTLNGTVSVTGGSLTGGSSSDLVVDGSGPAITLPAITGGLRSLTLSRAGGLTLGGPITITSRLTLTDGLLTPAGNLTLGNGAVIVRGNGSLSAPPTFGTSVNVTYSGSSPISTGPEIPTNPTVLNNLTNDNNGGLLLSGDLTINGRLALNNGLIFTGTNRVILGASAVVSGAGPSSYVSGNVQKSFNTGAGQSFTFPVGAVAYAPVSVGAMNVTTAGALTARVTDGDHPGIATNGLNAAKSVNRFWTLEPTSLVVSAYNITNNFASGGVDAGANPSVFVVRRFDGNGWFPTSVGVRTATTISAVGLTGFSDFAVGEQLLDHYAISAGLSQTAGTPFTVTVTAQDALNQTLVADSNTVITLNGTGQVQFDSNGDGIFGDNTGTLSGGVVTVVARDDLAETIALVAVDGNLVSGSLSNVVISLPAASYRSAGSGDWTSAATWETNNGAMWLPAADFPASADAGLITVRSGHVVTVTAPLSCDQLVVEPGGRLVLDPAAILSLTNGPGADLQVWGEIVNAGTITNQIGASVVFQSGSKYQHAFSTTPGNVPTAVWAADSTCEFAGYTTNTNPPTGLTQSFGNVTWNCAGQSGPLHLGRSLTNVRGNFTIVNTGSGTLIGSTNGGSAGTYTMNIGKDLILQGGVFDFANNVADPSGTPSFTLNLGGSYLQTGGTFTHTESEAPLLINFTGTNASFTQSGGTFTTTRINFNIASGAVLTLNSPITVASGRSFVVSSGGALYCGNNIIDGPGAFNVNSGGTLGIGASAGIADAPTASGNIQTSTRTFNTGANYVYNGTSAQVTGTGLPGTLNSLSISNAAGVTLSQTTTVNGTLALLAGILDTGTGMVILPTSGSVAGGAEGRYVKGSIRKAFATGSGQAFTFPLGDGSYYAPIDLVGLQVTAAGSLLARTVAGDHPLLSSSPIHSARSVNRYWTLTNSPAGIGVAGGQITFRFAGVGMDTDPAADPGTFGVARYNNGWTNLAVTGRSATNTSVSGFNAFGDFVVGNPIAGSPVFYSTNTILFTYSNRAALLADGWDFIGRTATGSPRNTETTVGTSPPDVAYVVTNASLGTVLRIPAGPGDLWGSANNSQNSLFRNLPTNWVSARLHLCFSPFQPFQQAYLGLYQDDDNYTDVGFAFEYPTNPVIAMNLESNGVPRELGDMPMPSTNVWLRLDRDAQYGLISGYVSVDGTNWTLLGQTDYDLVNPRLVIWAGASPSGYPGADLARLDLVTQDQPVATALAFHRSSLVFNAVAGEPCTNIQRVLVVRRGASGLQWTLTNTAPWLLVSTNFGKTPSSLDLSVNTAGIIAGVYETVLEFYAPGASNNPAMLPIRLIVNPNSRVRTATWRFGHQAAMSVWVDDSSGAMFNVLTDYGYRGTYSLWGVSDSHAMPSYFTNYYQRGMELGGHTVHHRCYLLAEGDWRSDLESNRISIVTFTPANTNELICFAYPCGLTSVKQQVVVGDYYLLARGYNLNQLEDPTPYDPLLLKCFNSHEHDPFEYSPSAPPNPADFKTVVDAAISQGKWANLVFHGLDNDNGAVAYTEGKEIWVAPAGEVFKYILLRDRTIISNYVETSGTIEFDVRRLLLDPSPIRSFETAVTTNDRVTLRVSLAGAAALTNVSVAGVPTTNYSLRTIDGQAWLFLDAFLTAAPQHVVLGFLPGTNHPPLLGTNSDVALPEGQMLVLTNTATDPETNALTFSLGPGAPSGMSITPEGVLTWMPTEAQGPGLYFVTVIVTDNGLPTMIASNVFNVTVQESNQPPTLPLQPDRYLAGQTPLVVVNTATDVDISANPLSYALLVAPTNAAISTNGVITWTPAPEQVPGVYTFTTVVTDTNPPAVNTQSLSATNTFLVYVTGSALTLPDQTNRVINELSTLVVTNTVIHTGITNGNDGQIVTNIFNFAYSDRAALLAAGWDFVARASNGDPRDTERTNGAVVSYDQTEHPGVLRIPVDVGDLWADLNDTRNSLFRNLSTNWLSLRLHLAFNPTQNYQQMALALYQDDDNYVEVGYAYNSGQGGQAVGVVREVNGTPLPAGNTTVPTTNIYLALDRNPANDNVTDSYSLDGSNWVSVATVSHSLTNTRLCIWAGGSPSGLPNLDLIRLDIVVSNPPNAVFYQLLNPPAGVTINSNGVITWTPDESQGPSTNWITTIVSDLSDPPLHATNSFMVIVNEVNSAPALNLPVSTNIAPLAAWSAQATATDNDIPTNALSFALVSGPSGLTVDTNGLISWMPTPAQSPSTNTVVLSVTDFNPDAVDFVSLSITGSFEIVVGPILIVTPDDIARAYGQTNPVLTGSFVGIQPGDNITATYSTPATTTSPIGAYPIIPELVDPEGKLTNYVVITNYGTLSVTQAVLVGTADPKTKVNGEPDPALTWQITSGALVNGDTLSGNITRVPGEDAGTYPILQGTLSASTNYALTFIGANLTILKSNAVVLLSDLSHVYDGTGKAASASTVPPGLNVELRYEGSLEAPTNVGSYTVVGMIVEINYQGAATNTLVILPAVGPFPITHLAISNNVVTITWNSISNRTYRVQYVTNISETNWSDLAPDITATGPSASQIDSMDLTGRRFYRVLLLP